METPLAKPFLKWAGGKGQLLSQLRSLYPKELQKQEINCYIEPFIGGGALFFDVIQNYSINSALIYDINPELIMAYQVVQRDVQSLIALLKDFAADYQGRDTEARKDYFYQRREEFNRQKQWIDFTIYNQGWIGRTALLIFLNRTCFNGLFRLNKNGDFNVPHGRYQNPKIVDPDNLVAVSRILQTTHIQLGDFEQCYGHITPETFIYFDPPYRPLSDTANFTAYSTFSFGDRQQIRLAKFFTRLDREKGAKLMLSNADPKNTNVEDDFFDDLYQDFTLHRILAPRMINSNAKKRGNVSEIVVTNY
ncbi:MULTISPECIES: DNA adenine methylase [unclassified Synechocystis]|uniref:DNA adenine methylase n=1 Tax=unclassified Synechocystis TaxID=2640012 RepID=UPI000426D018|nr:MULTISPECIES: DNA adenine methylase [unclassified Synechocystis]AIE75490.1 Methyl-directed repair DNA adenine methylase [Synechocystis sp. PCC 6714]MCT0253705.1 DNA adenine methylase [Synechocystis sp. CS-94]